MSEPTRAHLATELVGARERVFGARHVLVDEAGAVADDVAGARVEERRVAERAAQRDEVLRPEGVRVEGLVERRVEVHHTRHVDDRVQGALVLADPRSVDAAVLSADVAVDRHDLLAQEEVHQVERVGQQ